MCVAWAALTVRSSKSRKSSNLTMLEWLTLAPFTSMNNTHVMPDAVEESRMVNTTKSLIDTPGDRRPSQRILRPSNTSARSR